MYRASRCFCRQQLNPDSKVHGANMGSIWGRQDPGVPHAGPMNFAIWEMYQAAINSHNVLRGNGWSYVNLTNYLIDKDYVQPKPTIAFRFTKV